MIKKTQRWGGGKGNIFFWKMQIWGHQNQAWEASHGFGKTKKGGNPGQLGKGEMGTPKKKTKYVGGQKRGEEGKPRKKQNRARVGPANFETVK